MMQKSKSKEYKPHEVCQDRKEIARLLTVQRQEELQAQGIDPFFQRALQAEALGGVKEGIDK